MSCHAQNSFIKNYYSLYQFCSVSMKWGSMWHHPNTSGHSRYLTLKLNQNSSDELHHQNLTCPPEAILWRSDLALALDWLLYLCKRSSIPILWTSQVWWTQVTELVSKGLRTGSQLSDFKPLVPSTCNALPTGEQQSQRESVSCSPGCLQHAM